jgi:hypothetical protein
MKVRLAAVGSRPPRTWRGKTFLPAGTVSSGQWWLVRLVGALVMLVLAPASLLVWGWWLWGLRKRRWRWPLPVVGVVSALAVPRVVHGALGGIGLWRAGLSHAGAHIAGHPITGGAWSWAVLLGGGWMLGTLAGTWMGFLAWHRTPPWRDTQRPKTLWARWRERRLEQALTAGAGDLPGVVTFGIDQDTGKAVELNWAETAGHVLLVGGPGSGKTTTAERVVRASIRDGNFTAIVDMKASPVVIERASDWCHRWGRPLYVFSIDGPSRYDPFASNGDFSRKRDLLMATSDWSDPYYAARAGDYLLAVFYVLDLVGAPPQGWLPTVAQLLNPNLLAAATNRLTKADPRTAEAQRRVATVVEEARQDPRSLAGLAPRVRALTDTVVGQWVAPGEPRIDLLDVWDQGGVVLFSLPTLTHPESAAAFGGLVVQDLKTLAGTLQERKNAKPGLVFVDEFATLGAQNVSSALAMSREGGLRFMLATQDLGDLAVGPDGLAFVQKVLTDTNVKLIHSVGDAESAERLAKLAGMKWGVTERTAINQADSSFDLTTSTMAGHGTVDHSLVPVLEPTDVMNQGMGADGRFTLLSKAGEYVVTGAHTVPDRSTTPPDQPILAPLHVPNRFRTDEPTLVAAEAVQPVVDREPVQMIPTPRVPVLEPIPDDDPDHHEPVRRPAPVRTAPVQQAAVQPTVAVPGPAAVDDGWWTDDPA